MRCRFPFSGTLESRSGPDILLYALSEALRGDPRFVPFDAPNAPGDITWFPTFHRMGEILAAIRAGQRIAIGPNVLWGNSSTPLCDATEREIAGYQNYAGIFTLSRWYSASQQKHFAQKSNHYILDYPLPRAWLDIPWKPIAPISHLVYVKGGAEEFAIATQLSKVLPRGSIAFITYGRYTRADLLREAANAKACFYVSREDHYPLAAVEIGLMGCPIISDERSCPVVSHGLTGIIAPVRERGESEPFAWTPDAAERMAVEWKAAAAMDRTAIREATIRKHSPTLCRERVAAQLGLG